MRYKVSTDDRTFDIDITESGDLLDVRLESNDGSKNFRVDFQTGGQGSVHSMLVENQSYRIIIDRKGARHAVYTRGHRFEFLVEDERTFLMRSLIGAKTRKSDGEVKAPIPGLVSKMLVQEGDVVAHGQGVLILEAMKMENEIKSASPGTVAKIHVRPGQNVEKGQILFTVRES